jgi:signal transduction histidine kinase
LDDLSSTPPLKHLESHHLSALVAERLPRCVLVIDDDLRLAYANRAARDFFLHAYNLPLDGEPRLLDRLPTKEALQWRHFLLQAFAGEIVQGDHEREASDGSEQILEVEVRLLNEADDEAERVLVVFEDVTARRRYEQELLQMHDALEEANRTRDTIFSILGHDLRSPIAQLNALLYFFRRAPERLSPGKIEEYIRNLEDSTRHLSKALDNILHWSTLHRNSIQPTFQMVNVAEVAAESAGLLRLEAERKNIELRLESPDPLEIPTDPDLLAYIIRNLLANAIKFSHRSSIVRLRQSVDEDGHLTLEVIDQGLGMAKEHLSAVRNRDRILSTSGTSGEKGLGLGLTLCCEFCDLLGGALTIDSLAGQGTTVSVLLPGDWPDQA